jgi:hypothetical protein
MRSRPIGAVFLINAKVRSWPLLLKNFHDPLAMHFARKYRAREHDTPVFIAEILLRGHPRAILIFSGRVFQQYRQEVHDHAEYFSSEDLIKLGEPPDQRKKV